MGDFASLNLGGRVGDDPLTVEANRTLVANAFGVTSDQLLFMNQRQGNDVVVVNGPWQGEPPQADGVVTTSADVALAVRSTSRTGVQSATRTARATSAEVVTTPSAWGGSPCHGPLTTTTSSP